MKNFERISLVVDVEPLIAEIEKNPQLWDVHTARKASPGSPHSQMSDIWVRYNDFSRLGPNFNDEHVPVWYPAWDDLPALKQIVFDLMTVVRGEMLGGILITRIPPNMGIDRHIDTGWHVNYYEKFYVSLKNNPGAKFICHTDGDQESLEPEPGSIWLFDNRKPHSVENNSNQERMTLIVCIRTDMFERRRP